MAQQEINWAQVWAGRKEARRLARLEHVRGRTQVCEVCSTPKTTVVNGVCLECSSPERDTKHVITTRRRH